MNTVINPTILSKENNSFFEEYIELLINRLTHSSMALEHDLGEVNNHDNALRLKDNMIAFKKLIQYSFHKKEFTEEIIISTADIVNQDAVYISNGYRMGGGELYCRYNYSNKCPFRY